ncbi:MAG: tRNA (5-methylaminomethyl-2-thiouridine)(34)-methyltransferase MnmD [Siphonobacter aquaeclarae]|nr:tRNA (5-methylaminomethyl-2-thiouridine)(34)-methyltransferase MnmD [Siphonobacter aquaeclarae]
MSEGTSTNEEQSPESTAFSNDLVLTQDGTHTLYSARFGQWYHSVHGALEESRRVFLELGLAYFREVFPERREVRILEMGFGTGFNALLTLLEAGELSIHYTSLEAYPIPPAEYRQLNYDAVMGSGELQALHEAEWNLPVVISPSFMLEKVHTELQAYLETAKGPFDLVYYDAFAPGSQPELWTPEVFTGIARLLPSGGILTTYSAKGDVRRALQAAGFRVEKHPGPGRKREIVRAIKD